jgi:Ni,Fe-hydrogenase III large subunit
MTSSAVVCCMPVNDVQMLDFAVWRAELVARLKQGFRLVTLFGQRRAETVQLTAVVQDREGALRPSRTVVSADSGYRELTSERPELHCFERELHEQTGLNIPSHPWLKPVRYEGREPASMGSYPFYEVQGKEVHEVAVGPIHAGVIEPGSFRFSCLGEQVHHLEIQLGYQHRGVERRLLEREPRLLAPLVETIAGDTSVGHAWAYCAAVESLAACEPGLDVDVGRAVALELERIAMHLAGLSGLAADIGFLQGATTYGRLRTTAINTTMRLCGSRFGRGALRPGGVKLQLTSELLKLVGDNVEILRRELVSVNALFLSARTVQHRLRGVGTLSNGRANELGLVGLVGRASGVALDARQWGRAGAYRLLPLEPVVLTDGDCWARAKVRVEELDASLSWIAAVLERHANWRQPLRPVAELSPNHLAISLVEGWRGEIVHCLETDARGALSHYKVQDPSFRNWMGLALALRGNEISDFPICNKSFDLSYCGHDL